MKEFVSKYSAEEIESFLDQMKLIEETDPIGGVNIKLKEVKETLYILTADADTLGSVNNKIQEALKWVAK